MTGPVAEFSSPDAGWPLDDLDARGCDGAPWSTMIATGTFLRANWRWVLLAPVLMLLGTELHESSHGIGALLTGGHVTQLIVLPSFSRGGLVFGQTFDLGVPPERTWLVTLFPFLTAHVHALAGALIAARVRGFLGRLLFFTSVLLPLLDVSMLHSGLFLHSTVADLGAFAGDELLFFLVGTPALALLLGLAWRAFRANWPTPESLSGPWFCALLAVLLLSPWLRFLLHVTR